MFSKIYIILFFFEEPEDAPRKSTLQPGTTPPLALLPCTKSHHFSDLFLFSNLRKSITNARNSTQALVSKVSVTSPAPEHLCNILERFKSAQEFESSETWCEHGDLNSKRLEGPKASLEHPRVFQERPSVWEFRNMLQTERSEFQTLKT